jgi:two-component system heavy metal sensor histidine kinase CusS
MFWMKHGSKLRKKAITRQLTSLYTLATFTLVIVISVFLFYIVRNVIVTGEVQYLIDEVQVIKNLIGKHPLSLSSVTQEINGVPLSLKDASYHYYVRLVGQRNKTLMITPGFIQTLKAAPFNLKTDNWQSNVIRWYSSDGKSFLLLSAPLDFEVEGKRLNSIEIALDDSYQHSLIKYFGYKLIGFLIICLAIIYIIGSLITRKGLRPLHSMAYTAECITIECLSQRINILEWPVEFTSLGNAFNKMLNGLDEAFKRLSQCTSELAHELRTPINNLLGQTEVALSRPRTETEYRYLLGSNYEEYQRIGKLVESILFLSKANNPHTKIQRTIFNVADELSSLCEYYQLLASEKNIKIRILGSAFLYGDQILFRRAVSNLVENSVHYTPPNGNVSIEVQASKTEIKLSVIDTGIGIIKENVDLIFDRFYRVDHKHIHTDDGLGLGLSIVRVIMDLHKGYIKIDSNVGVGTRIDLFFPVITA